MRIQRVEFRNFRTFADFDFEINGRSLWIIGENAAGKSSLLTGMARALGHDLRFASSDFGDRSKAIELRILLTNIEPDQRAIFGNYVTFGHSPSLQLQARAVWDPTVEEAEVEHGYARTPGSRSRREERDAVPVQWLPAARDAARLLQFGVPRNLMGRVMESLPIEAALEAAVDSIKDAAQRLGTTDEFVALLDGLRARLDALIPDVGRDAYSIDIAAVASRDLLRQLELIVQHLGGPVGIATQSSGLSQLSVFILAMQLARNDPGTILLVDEPEISLHPQSQRALIRALAELDCQMILATHSASLLDRVDPRTVMRLRRGSRGIEIVSPAALDDEEAGRLSRFTGPQVAEAFFARTVVLVEGLSDQLALEALARRLRRNLDASGVAIVPIGGAASIGSFLRLFGPRGFDLPVRGLLAGTDSAQS